MITPHIRIIQYINQILLYSCCLIELQVVAKHRGHTRMTLVDPNAAPSLKYYNKPVGEAMDAKIGKHLNSKPQSILCELSGHLVDFCAVFFLVLWLLISYRFSFFIFNSFNPRAFQGAQDNWEML